MRATSWIPPLATLGFLAGVLGEDLRGQALLRSGTPAEARAIQQQLELGSWELEDLALPGIPEFGGFDAVVEHEGVDYLLDLHPWSVRAPDAKLFVVGDDGVWRERPLPLPATYRGDAIDLRTGAVVGTAVATAANDGKIDARVRMHLDDARWHVQPLADVLADAAPGRHVVYREQDVLPGEGRCGVDFLGDGARGDASQDPGGAGAAEAPGDDVVEVGIDCDHAFFQWAGGTRDATVRSVENVLIDVSDIYSADTGTVMVTTFYVVRETSGADPYSSTNPSTLLNQFDTQWTANEKGLPRDVAHLFTGRNLDGSVIGIASLSVVCIKNAAFSLSQSSFSSNSARRAALTAHELGHNFSASHCDSKADCRIMCSVLGGCTGNIQSFGPNAKNSIKGFKNSATCFGVAGPALTAPFFDDFESGIQPGWLWNNGAEVSTAAVAEPSGSNALLLNAAGPGRYNDDFIETDDWAQAEFASTVNISYWLQIGSADGGEEFRVGAYRKNKKWGNVETVAVPPFGRAEKVFSFHSVTITDPVFLGPRFKFRFSVEADSDTDAFYVDDVSVTMSSGLTVAGGEDDGLGGRKPVHFTVVGAPPDRPVLLYAGFGSVAHGSFRPHKGFQLDLTGEVLPLARFQTDSQGRGMLELAVPPGLQARSFWVQALVLADEPESTPPQRVVIQP